MHDQQNLHQLPLKKITANFQVGEELKMNALNIEENNREQKIQKKEYIF